MSTYSPTASSSYETNDFEEISSIAPSSSISSRNKGKEPILHPNDPNFKLESNENSKIYIFQNYLYTRNLLPIKENEERRMEIRCTT
jgi:hypothetical protein